LVIASSCPVVLVDHVAETLPASYRGIHRDHDGWFVVRWQLLPALMRAVVAEVVHVLADQREGGARRRSTTGRCARGAGYAPSVRCSSSPRRAWRGLDHGDALGSEDLIERGAVLAVPVAGQEPGSAGTVVAEVHDEVAACCTTQA
jgi:hypothetical protein